MEEAEREDGAGVVGGEAGGLLFGGFAEEALEFHGEPGGAEFVGEFVLGDVAAPGGLAEGVGLVDVAGAGSDDVEEEAVRGLQGEDGFARAFVL